MKKSPLAKSVKKTVPRPARPAVDAQLATHTALSADWYWEQDARFRFTAVSGGIRKRIGLDSAGLIGHTRWGSHSVPVGDGGKWDKHKATLKAGKPFKGFVYQSIDPRGGVRYIECSGNPVFDEQRRVAGYRGVGRDVTALVQMERRLTIEHAVTRLLAEHTIFADAATAIIRTVCETLGFVCGARWVLDPGSPSMQCDETWGKPGRGVAAFLKAAQDTLPFKGRGGLMRRVWNSGEPVWVRDIATSKTYRRAAEAREAGLHSGFAFPLKAGDQLLGVMEFFSAEVRQPDAELLATAAYIGRQIGQSLRLRRGVQLMQLEHAITACLTNAESASAGLRHAMQTICDTQGWECARYLGVDEKSGVMRHEEGWGIAAPAVTQYLEKSKQWNYKPGQGLIGLVWQSGEPLWVENVLADTRTRHTGPVLAAGLRGGIVFPVKWGNRTMGALACFSRKLRAPDQRLLRAFAVIGSQIGQFVQHKHEQRLTLLEHAVTRCLANAETGAQGVREAMRAICEMENWQCARFFKPDEAAALLRLDEYWAIADPGVARFLEHSKLLTYQAGIGLTGMVWQSGEPVWVADVTGDARASHASLALDAGTRSVMAIPVKSDNQIIGVLSFSGNNARSPDQRMLQAVGVIGSQIGQFLQRKLAEHEQHASEERFRDLTRLSSDWYWEQDEQFRFTFISGTQVEQFGLIESAYRGRTRWELPAINHSEASWAEHRALLERREAFYDFEVCRPGLDEQLVWTASSGMPLFDDAGKFKGYRGIGKNISERKRNEQLLQMEHQVARCLASESSTTAALTGALRTVCETVDWNCGRFFRVDASTDRLRLDEAWGIDDPAIKRYLAGQRQATYAKGEGLVGLAWQSGQVLWVQDATRDQRTLYMASVRDSGFHGIISVPIAAGDEILGVLAFNCREMREPSDRLMQAMRLVGSQIGQFVQRKHAQGEQSRFRAAMDASADIVLLVDPVTLRYIDANEEACRALGYSRDELLRLGPPDVTSISRADFVQLYQRMVTNESPAPTARGYYRRKDGSTFQFEAQPRPLRTEEGHVIVSLARDITDRLAAERQLLESERRFADVVHAAGQYVWELDANLCFTYLSARAEQIMEYRLDEMLGRSVADFSPETDKARLTAAFKRELAAKAEFHNVESRRVTKTGRRIWLRYSGTSIFDEAGKLTGYRGTALDISAQKRADKRELMAHLATRLLAESATLGAAISGILQMVCEQMGWACGARWRLDETDGTLHSIEAWGIDDEAVAEFLKASRRLTIQPSATGLIGRAISTATYVRIEDVSRETDFQRANIAGAAGLRGAIALPLKIDNQVFGALEFYSRRPFPTEEGLDETTHRIGGQIAQSIARRQAEATARRARDLARSNTELQQFAYVASHDLQEPLRMISSYTQLLMRRTEGKLDQDAREFADFIIDGAARMKKLIEDLLAYSRVGSRGAKFAPVECEVVLAKVLVNLRTAIESCGAIITHDALPVIIADDSQLLQLLQNLISNAIKFRDQKTPAVHISAEEREEAWVLSVRDNGIGIEAQYFERIFVMFQRLHGKAEYPGTGIGLAICQKVMEQHGGHIQVQSQPGHGCTFYCSFPKRQTGETENI